MHAAVHNMATVIISITVIGYLHFCRKLNAAQHVARQVTYRLLDSKRDRKSLRDIPFALANFANLTALSRWIRMLIGTPVDPLPCLFDFLGDFPVVLGGKVDTSGFALVKVFDILSQCSEPTGNRFFREPPVRLSGYPRANADLVNRMLVCHTGDFTEVTYPCQLFRAKKMK